MIRGAESRNLVDLDADRFFAADDLIAYADALLAQDGFANPGPPGGAWECYRQNEDVRARLARVVASRADRNYLVAGMSAFQLAEDDKVLDPASALFDPSVVPSGIGEALSKYLDRLPAQRRRREAGLLTALAYGRGAGLDDQRWLAFTRALGYEDVTTDDLAELKDSAAADYLLETSTEPGGLVTRLFHQALADELVAGRDRRDDEARLVRLLRAEGGDRGWLASSPYARNHAPSHAAEAGLLERFVREADFLVGMAPAAMRSAVLASRRAAARTRSRSTTSRSRFSATSQASTPQSSNWSAGHKATGRSRKNSAKCASNGRTRLSATSARSTWRWPASTATPARCGGWRRWTGRAWTTR